MTGYLVWSKEHHGKLGLVKMEMIICTLIRYRIVRATLGNGSLPYFHAVNVVDELYTESGIQKMVALKILSTSVKVLVVASGGSMEQMHNGR